MAKLIMFHGRECPHCKVMMPLVDKLEKETGLSIEKLEVWHNEKNADLMRSYRDIIEPKCGGQLRTPTFFNTENQDVICGEMEYEKLKEWASG
ncbi:MAG: thioredoxin family protein [Candidatus Aminicenantes bacterium]|nr:thioredoxin family protein [Candidatus Aminicenantes bacterium]